MPFLGLIVLVLLVLFLVGAMPAWPHSRNWGYGPSGVLGLLVLVLLVLLLIGVVPHPWGQTVVVR